MRLIKTQKFTVVIDPTVIERIKSKDITLGYADISRNSVTVFGNVHQRLLNAGIIEPLEKIRDDADDPITMWALNNYHINYDMELGLLY
jgi:cystathionine beta-lyase/cystathionine gamma-synthase